MFPNQVAPNTSTPIARRGHGDSLRKFGINPGFSPGSKGCGLQWVPTALALAVLFDVLKVQFRLALVSLGDELLGEFSEHGDWDLILDGQVHSSPTVLRRQDEVEGTFDAAFRL